MDAELTRARFAEAIMEASNRVMGVPWSIGSDDCAFWGADIDLTVLGSDPASPYRSRFDDDVSREYELGSRGVVGALLETARRMRWRRIEPKAAKAGDRCLMRVNGDWAGGLFDGQFWITRIDRGVSAWPHSVVRRAWSIFPDGN